MGSVRTKRDLIIEVWEALDCESVGSAEILAIEKAVEKRFGRAAVDSPMIVARLLADEGAELRHPEILSLYVDRNSNLEKEAAFRNIIDISGFGPALASIRRLDNLRRKFQADGDTEGLRLIQKRAIMAKNDARARVESRRGAPETRELYREIAEWFTIWLQSPEIFDGWIRVRRTSADFAARFGTDAAADKE